METDTRPVVQITWKGLVEFSVGFTIVAFATALCMSQWLADVIGHISWLYLPVSTLTVLFVIGAIFIKTIDKSFWPVLGVFVYSLLAAGLRDFMPTLQQEQFVRLSNGAGLIGAFVILIILAAVYTRKK